MERHRKKDGAGRGLAIGCALCFFLFALVWTGLGVFNLSFNDLSFTEGWRKKKEDLAHPRNEFSDPPSSQSFHAGVTAPARQVDGVAFTPYRFDDVLEGQGRVLEIGVPHGTTGVFDISEPGVPMEGERNAFLFYEHMCCAPMEQFNAIIQLAEGAESDPHDLFSTHFARELPAGLDEVHLVSLTFSNIFNWHANAVTWARGPEGTWTVASTAVDAGRGYDVVDVAWRVRSESEVRRARWGVVPAVALDMATGPLQLAFLLLLAPGVR